MQRHDPHDQFLQTCRSFGQYPKHQRNDREPHEILEAMRLGRLLDNKKSELFNDSEAKVEVLETGRRNRFPDAAVVKSVSKVKALQQHLDRPDKDPHVRHLFIVADDSRSPLNCSADMFKYICVYQQIEPSFLESLYSFGYQTYPIDLCLAHFRSRPPLDGGASTQVALPKLGRSGRAIHLSYLLRSVECSASGKREIDDWQIRQTANYHSFDIETGRSFWLTIKANGLFRDRVKEVTPHLNVPSKPDGDVSSYLKTSLATHLVYLSWCDEGWREFINDLETSIRETVLPARSALVDDHIDTNSSVWPETLQPSRRETMQSYNRSRTNTAATGAPSEKTTLPIVKELSGWLGRAIFGAKETNPDEEQGIKPTTGAPNTGNSLSGLDPSGSLDRLRVKDIQTLYSRSELIQRALLVLDLNIGVLRDIYEYYDKLTKIEFEGSVYAAIMGGFFNELTVIMRRLETRRAQLSTLSAHLSQSIQLYELVLQQRSNHIGVTFADSAHKSADQMKIIADKTSRETASMHVITVVTLIFLPATFVATFFQSGVLLWNEETPEDMVETFRYQEDSLRLFVAICGPLTTITMGIWLFVFLKMKRRAKKNDEAH